MDFTPIRMVSKDGRSCLVGSATEREQLRVQGYTIAPEPGPAPTPEPKRPAPVKKTESK